MSDGQMTIWGGSTAVGLPVTSPARRAARRSDPPTSQGAAILALEAPNVHGFRAQCLEFIRLAGDHGLTDHELAAMFDPPRLQVSAGKRRLELQRDGLVTRADFEGQALRRLSPSGVPCQAWRATTSRDRVEPCADEDRAASAEPPRPTHPSVDAPSHGASTTPAGPADPHGARPAG